MIGVISREDQKAVVEEFFELFKTPWSPYREGGDYDVVISTDLDARLPSAKLVLAFSPETIPTDRRNEIKILSRQERGDIESEDSEIPIYGPLATFEGPKKTFLSTGNGQTAGLAIDLPGRRILRLGYDLFDEIEYLLHRGQPAGNAQTPTLEMHIFLLRKWILGAGIPLVEIPPFPYGYDFITCLTHDIDFMGIRDHKFDHTVLGFLYRSLVPKYSRGLDKKTARERYFKNLRAVFSLPLVQAGLLPDIWYPLDKYAEVEKELTSTFFFIPFKGQAGKPTGGKAARYRAARYDVGRYRGQIRSLQDQGREVGLHGIDSWHDPRKGRDEVAVIRGITRRERVGVRMHWLYFSEETPKCLEEAGFYYDSTLGYNETVGFRSGTTQVFRFPGTSKLYELPLHAQDTAMFYPDRMGVSESRAVELFGKLIGEVKAHGGAFTVNWHDRSLAPERNWDASYRSLLGILRGEKTWFATGSEAVAWFEKRRACRFEGSESPDRVPKVKMEAPGTGTGPPLTLRVHRPPVTPGGESLFRDSCLDFPLTVYQELPVGH